MTARTAAAWTSSARSVITRAADSLHWWWEARRASYRLHAPAVPILTGVAVPQRHSSCGICVDGSPILVDATDTRSPWERAVHV